VFIDSLNSSLDMFKVLMVSDIVGIDSEWRRSFIPLDEWPISILQISTREKAYLIDCD